MTYALPRGAWSSRNCAVARADVHIGREKPRAQVARRVAGVVGENEEPLTRGGQPRDELVRTPHDMTLVDENAIHVGEPAVDRLALCHQVLHAVTVRQCDCWEVTDPLTTFPPCRDLFHGRHIG